MFPTSLVLRVWHPIPYIFIWRFSSSSLSITIKTVNGRAHKYFSQHHWDTAPGYRRRTCRQITSASGAGFERYVVYPSWAIVGGVYSRREGRTTVGFRRKRKRNHDKETSNRSSRSRLGATLLPRDTRDRSATGVSRLSATLRVFDNARSDTYKPYCASCTEHEHWSRRQTGGDDIGKKWPFQICSVFKCVVALAANQNDNNECSSRHTNIVRILGPSLSDTYIFIHATLGRL